MSSPFCHQQKYRRDGVVGYHAEFTPRRPWVRFPVVTYLFCFRSSQLLQILNAQCVFVFAATSIRTSSPTDERYHRHLKRWIMLCLCIVTERKDRLAWLPSTFVLPCSACVCLLFLFLDSRCSCRSASRCPFFSLSSSLLLLLVLSRRRRRWRRMVHRHLNHSQLHTSATTNHQRDQALNCGNPGSA